jgi:hypothetical protein
VTGTQIFVAIVVGTTWAGVALEKAISSFRDVKMAKYGAKDKKQDKTIDYEL